MGKRGELLLFNKEFKENLESKPILDIRWPDVIGNDDLWQLTQQDKLQQQIWKKKWRRIGHESIVLEPPEKTENECAGDHKGHRAIGEDGVIKN